ncbi:MAG: UDP-N-acetylmuramyl-tripeptide synthetase [Candidatus Levybacteria bacterium]|nr:UDP-N-acetylmuramyl-tripeptide synthetase [Candidatus Levybacteria bacterium]
MLQWFKNQYHLSTAFLANIYYRFPSRHLTIIGITGTSGKSTTTHMVYSILKQAGYRVAMLSTVKGVIGGKEYDTGFHVTTPDPHNLPKYLRQAVDSGDQYFVLEVSSHALDQNRAAFVHFKVGVLTTLAHEHLDYHKTMINYAKAKFKLLQQATFAVAPAVGLDETIKEAVGFGDIQKKLTTFGLEKGDLNQNDWKLSLSMPGDFNMLDALAAAAASELVGVKKEIIKKSLATFEGIQGRFEEIPTKKDFRIVIDFAHKPDALEGVIRACRQQVKGKGRIIVMYGLASQRDTLKRPIMGEISGRLAEITVLTDEDPRFEEPMKIINEVAVGCKKAGAKEGERGKGKGESYKGNMYFKIPNRKEAIEFIVTKLARKDDIILLCGKGHEASMNYMGKELPWSEHKAVKAALALL